MARICLCKKNEIAGDLLKKKGQGKIYFIIMLAVILLLFGALALFAESAL